MTDQATCVNCGCTDLRACTGGCSWLAVNRDDSTGVCSSCPKHLTAWRAEQAAESAAERREQHREEQQQPDLLGGGLP